MGKKKGEVQFRPSAFHRKIAEELILYAKFIVDRGWVHNTLGNIAIRVWGEYYPEHGVIYTKRRGVSLEEMNRSDVVVTDVREGSLLWGGIKPSIGHQLNREIFRCRPDVNAVIHLHVSSVIAFFSAIREREMRFISDDAPLVLGAPVVVLEPEINVEKDVGRVSSFISETNCFIMPNHGTTTLGRHLSEAYHRMCTIVAEVERIKMAGDVACAFSGGVRLVPDEEVNVMFRMGEGIIYGDK